MGPPCTSTEMAGVELNLTSGVLNAEAALPRSIQYARGAARIKDMGKTVVLRHEGTFTVILQSHKSIFAGLIALEFSVFVA